MHQSLAHVHFSMAFVSWAVPEDGREISDINGSSAMDGFQDYDQEFEWSMKAKRKPVKVVEQKSAVFSAA